MNHKFRHYIHGFAGSLFLLLFFTGLIQAAKLEKAESQELSDLPSIIEKVKKAVQTRDFNILKSYVPNKSSLYWASCGDEEGDSVKELSLDKMISLLLKFSKEADIYVFEKPDITAGNLERSVLTVRITTDGWIGEYPFLVFSFTYAKTDNHWEWKGVCDSAGPPLRISKDNKKYEEVYYRHPKLPRSGPRIFKDRDALKARIREILQFKTFDALRPYAVNQKLMFGECSQGMINDEIKGSITSIDQIIDFLKENEGGTRKISSARGHHYKYVDTEGWEGKYPYISFWIAEGKKGWELAGVAYCRSSLAEFLKPVFK